MYATRKVYGLAVLLLFVPMVILNHTGPLVVRVLLSFIWIGLFIAAFRIFFLEVISRLRGEKIFSEDELPIETHEILRVERTPTGTFVWRVKKKGGDVVLVTPLPEKQGYFAYFSHEKRGGRRHLVPNGVRLA